jgi:hypothetical protein
MNNFTEKQREIVARKLGYDGPMQGFDDFLNSSPALGMKYANITDKFATRMAKGGVVRKKRGYAAGGLIALSDAEWSTLKPEQKISYFNEQGITPAQLANVGVSQADLDWMKTQGYTGVAAPVAPIAGLTTAQQTAAANLGSTTFTPTPAPVMSGLTDAQQVAAANLGATPAPAPAPAPAPVSASQAPVGGSGYTTSGAVTNSLPTNWNTFQPNDKINWFNNNKVTEAQLLSEGVPQADINWMKNNGYNAGVTATTTGAATTGTANRTGTTGGGVTTTTGAAPNIMSTGAPVVPGATTYTAAQTTLPAGAVAGQAAPTTTAGVTNIAAPTPITLPTSITAPTVTAASAVPAITSTLTGLDAQQGTVSEAAKALAATQVPATTAVAGTEAAQGVAGTVQGAPTRVAQAGEMVSGTGVDMVRAEQIMSQTQAAQGQVTEDMTIQGQLNKLTRDFDAGNPPPWAAASMRAATAQMAARGLGASSMAGQAIIQATLEAATPIAAADAKVFETMGLQNLSNRQQTAMLIGQQRAAFLGQEFDQAFQTKVLNAAKVADIANRNFDAQTTIALENSRLASTMDVANLSARNAVVLGKMAQMSQLETMNLSNRQQVAVENARAALQMDIKNLDNRQQTALFRAQEMNDAIISDAGFTNATNITNAQNTIEAAKVSASLMQSAQQFNADLLYKVNSTNALAANEVSRFNAQQANARQEFNANMTTQINLANARILADISTANTAAVNAANAVNAKNATDLSAAAYAQQSQTYRDLLEMSWKTGESEKDRATQIAAATLTSSASVNAAKTTSSNEALANIAKAGVTLAVNYDKVKAAIGDFFD